MKKYFLNSDCDLYEDEILLNKIYTRIREGKEDFIEQDIARIKRGISKEKQTNNSPCFLAGIKYDHYGHFLLESLSRLSNYNQELDKPIVWIGGKPELTKFQRELLEILGLNERKHIFISSETFFKDLEVTARGYVIWDHFTTTHSNFLRKVKLDKESEFFNKRVWISRSGFKTYKNEWLIESILSQNDWIIVDPTDLNVLQQAKLFSSAKKIAGIEGSAFHTMVLCEDICKDVTIFSRKDGGLNGNYITIDKVMRNNHNLLKSRLVNRDNIELDFVFNSLEINISKFQRELIVGVEGYYNSSFDFSTLNRSIDSLIKAALSIENVDIGLALDLMNLALKHRPNGPFVNSKVEKYKKIVEGNNDA